MDRGAGGIALSGAFWWGPFRFGLTFIWAKRRFLFPLGRTLLFYKGLGHTIRKKSQVKQVRCAGALKKNSLKFISRGPWYFFFTMVLTFKIYKMKKNYTSWIFEKKIFLPTKKGCFKLRLLALFIWWGHLFWGYLSSLEKKTFCTTKKAFADCTEMQTFWKGFFKVFPFPIHTTLKNGGSHLGQARSAFEKLGLYFLAIPTRVRKVYKYKQI